MDFKQRRLKRIEMIKSNKTYRSPNLVSGPLFVIFLWDQRRKVSFISFPLSLSLNPSHCGAWTDGQAAAGLMINDVYSWLKATLFICIAAQQIPSVTWMKNIHSYQFCRIIEWSHFPSVDFFSFSPLSPSLSSLALSPLSGSLIIATVIFVLPCLIWRGWL